MRFVFVAVAALVLAGCKEEVVDAPPPVDITEETVSFFCQMDVSEHGGPKGQIHLQGFPSPLFFAQVRDLVAYLKSPERDAQIIGVYVSDMGAAPSWDNAGAGNWILASEAQFVVGAQVAGGMGAPEVVPFLKTEAAQDFATEWGGDVMALDDIPAEVVLGPVEIDLTLETPS